MITYKVLNYPSKELKAVKSGIAWLAIPFITCLPIFPVWFLFKGLWKIFIAYIFLVRLFRTNKTLPKAEINRQIGLNNK